MGPFFLFKNQKTWTLWTACLSGKAQTSLGEVPLEGQDKRVVICTYEGDRVLDFQFSRSRNFSSPLLALKSLGRGKSRAQKLKFRPKKIPRFEDYAPKFERGYAELVAGNCYQFNLTEKFSWHLPAGFKKNPLDFFLSYVAQKGEAHRWPAYSHIFFDGQNLGLVSETPESLFRMKLDPLVISARPIKGTYRLRPGMEAEWPSHFRREFLNNPKHRAELFMISDLLRNDLTAIQEEGVMPYKNVARITHRQVPLLVPGLLHQYSVVERSFDQCPSFLAVMGALFPGGSITGAPKRRVMQILGELEAGPRGFYCGGTVLFSPQRVESSINIRTLEVDFEKEELGYGAGGGITLKSQVQEEWEELMNKLRSVLVNFL